MGQEQRSRLGPDPRLHGADDLLRESVQPVRALPGQQAHAAVAYLVEHGLRLAVAPEGHRLQPEPGEVAQDTMPSERAARARNSRLAPFTSVLSTSKKAATGSGRTGVAASSVIAERV